MDIALKIKINKKNGYAEPLKLLEVSRIYITFEFFTILRKKDLKIDVCIIYIYIKFWV